MRIGLLGFLALGASLLGAGSTEAAAQHPTHDPQPPAEPDSTHRGQVSDAPPAADTANAPAARAAREEHAMWMQPLGRGWRVGAMGQVFPIVTSGSPNNSELPIHDTELYATQPAAMLTLGSPDQVVVLRTTLDFEAWTQPDGEYTFGSWGEGFIDKRHPHTLLHEATLSLNGWNLPGGSASLTLGKGFVPFGTEDPMSRPVAKYPTNHHLSQILERWMVGGAYLLRSGLSLEASVFGGDEPADAYDLSNLDGFGESFSARLTQRFGGGGPMAPWEISVSWGHVEQERDGTSEATELYNAAVRHKGRYKDVNVYVLAEGSRSEPDGEEGYWSTLAETRLEFGRHRPYYRFEYATRPEYEREGLPGTTGFYRYDHDAHPIAASRWQIHALGYEVDTGSSRFTARPFVEVQYNRVAHEGGEFDPVAAFGDDRFWSLSTGFKIFLGGEGMRMGNYGVLDPMTNAMRRPQHEH